MAKQVRKTVDPAKKFESILGKSDRIKTNVYTTTPKVSIEIVGRIPDEIIKEIPFVLDAFLKEKGY